MTDAKYRSVFNRGFPNRISRSSGEHEVDICSSNSIYSDSFNDTVYGYKSSGRSALSISPLMVHGLKSKSMNVSLQYVENTHWFFDFCTVWIWFVQSLFGIRISLGILLKLRKYALFWICVGVVNSDWANLPRNELHQFCGVRIEIVFLEIIAILIRARNMKKFVHSADIDNKRLCWTQTTPIEFSRSYSCLLFMMRFLLQRTTKSLSVVRSKKTKKNTMSKQQ